MELTVLYNCMNIAREFRWEIGDNAPKFGFRDQSNSSGEYENNTPKMNFSEGDNYLYTPRKIQKRDSSCLLTDWLSHLEMNVKTQEKFCKDASQTFFNEFGLVSHQINSFS